MGQKLHSLHSLKTHVGKNLIAMFHIVLSLEYAQDKWLGIEIGIVWAVQKLYHSILELSHAISKLSPIRK